MLVFEQHKRLIVPSKDPNNLVAKLPGAKLLPVQNKLLVAAKHDVPSTKILRQEGYSAPSPILYYYKWSGRFTPYDHQAVTAAFLTMHNKCLVLNEIGTGKSNSALWAADYLMNEGLVKKVLVVSPLSTLERVWADSVFMDFPHRTSVTLHGSAKRRSKLLNSPADFYIINHEGVDIIKKEAAGVFDLVIVDEAAVLRNPDTDRFKAVKWLMDRSPDAFLWLMTGTPTPNEPTDAWALAKLVGSPNLNKPFTAFRDSVMMKIGQWTYVPKPGSVDTVRHVLTPAIRYSREECLDLPETVFQRRHAAMTPDQQVAFKTMMKKFVVESQQGQITAVNEAVKVQKLVQIACGVAYDDEGNHVEIDASSRLKVLTEIITEAGGKVIVFVPLTGALHMLVSALSKKWTVAAVNGEVPASARNEIFRAFQQDPDPQILVAHPGTMAHGLTLTAASTIVWYGPINSNEQYTQANGRIERIGKKNVSLVVHIEGSELERRMYDRLETKQKTQGILLDLIEQDRMA